MCSFSNGENPEVSLKVRRGELPQVFAFQPPKPPLIVYFRKEGELKKTLVANTGALEGTPPRSAPQSKGLANTSAHWIKP